MISTMRQQVRAGTLWVSLQAVLKQALDLLVFLGLARWLLPEHFGLMALIQTVLAILVLSSEMGIVETLVQRRHLGARTLDTAFWMVSGMVTLLAMLLGLIALPLSQIYGQPEIQPLVWSCMPLLLAAGLNVVPQAVLQRQMQFRILTVRTLCGTLAGAAVGLALAHAGYGVWSLLGQQLVASTVALMLLWRLSSWRPSLRASWRLALGLWRYGRHVLSARLLNVVASKVDDAFIGFFLGPVALGAYAVASRLRLALEQLFCQGVDAVALSAFSRLAVDRKALGLAYLQAIRVAVTVALPVFAAGIWIAPPVLPLLIGDRWMASMQTLQILLVAGLLQAFLHFNHAVFRALGQPQRSWQIGLVSLALNLCLGLVAVRWGIEAMAWSYVLRVALVGPWGSIRCLRELNLRWLDIARILREPAFAALLALLPATVMYQLPMPFANSSWGRAVLGCTLFICVYGYWVVRSLVIADLLIRRQNVPGDSHNHKREQASNRRSRPARAFSGGG